MMAIFDIALHGASLWPAGTEGGTTKRKPARLAPS